MERMPALFIGHGSPMNAIEDNEFTKNWRKIASEIPRPKAILVISAHWYTSGTRIMDEAHPRMIYDMYGFPKELYQVDYKASGTPELARFTKNLISRDTMIDNSWGYDHGACSVLHVMYPNADIPVYQLSVDGRANADIHFNTGKEIKRLRENGVLILGSGNVVHNLSIINMSMAGGYDWAYEFDNYMKDKITKHDYQDVVDYKKAGKSSALAVATPDHFFPLLYVLGATDGNDDISVYNDSCLMGSMSMTSYLFK